MDSIGWLALANDDEASVLRYLAIGFEEDGKFTGLVLDYAGGGAWGDLYMLAGQRDAGADAEELTDLDDDELEERMELARPGLMERIHDLRATLVVWSEDGVPHPTPELRDALRAGGRSAVNGTLVESSNRSETWSGNQGTTCSSFTSVRRWYFRA